MGKRLRIALLIASLVLLGSCSRLELAYRNLDWLIPWSLDSYVSLNKEQKAWLKPRLVKHIAWHCSTQLPAYVAWLQQSETLVTEAQPSAERFDAQFAAFRQAVDALFVQVAPDLSALLQSLSDAQVQELRESLLRQNQEQQEDYLQPSLSEQIDERAERMEERLQPWFGRLHSEQKARVQAWSAQLDDYNQDWLANNQRWQQAFLAALQQRQSEQFPAQMEQLLRERMSVWTPTYRQRFLAAEAALGSLFADLVGSADSKQRERLQNRLEGARKQLSELTCP